MGKQVICKLNLRPRINLIPTLILAGEAFDEDILNEESKQMMLKNGELEYVEDSQEQEEAPQQDKKIVLKELKAEALEKHGIDLKGQKFNTVEKVQAELERLNAGQDKAKEAPKGIFHVPASDLEGFNLDELDAMHAEICADNKLPAPVPFETVEEGIAKLTGNAE